MEPDSPQRSTMTEQEETDTRHSKGVSDLML